MMALLSLIFGLCGSWLLGIFIVVATYSLLTSRQTATPRLTNWEVAGLGLLTGIGATGQLLMLASLSGIPLVRPVSFTIATSGWILGSWQLLRRKASSPEIAVTPKNSSLQICLQTFFWLLFISLLLQTLQTPQRLWDERAIYGIKAKVLFEDRTLNSDSLLDPDFVQYHPRYPLLLPVAELHVYELLGSIDDRLSKILFPLLFLGMCLTFAGVLTRNLNGDLAWLMTCMLATVPSLTFWEYGFMTGQADAPMACFHGIAVLYLWDWFRHRSPLPAGTSPLSGHLLFLLLTGGLFMGLAAFTKDEGIAFLFVDVLAFSLCVALLLPGTTLWKTGVIATVSSLAILVILPSLWHRQSLPKTGEMAYVERLHLVATPSGLAALGWSLRHLSRRMLFEPAHWGLQWWGMVLAAVAFPRRVTQASQLFLVIDLAGALAALLIAGMIAPTTVEEHIGGSSHRFLMQLAPVAVLFLVGQFAPERQEPTDLSMAAPRHH